MTCAGLPRPGLCRRIPLADIAEIMGWEPSRVERIIRRYVGRSAVARRIIQRLDKTRKVNPDCKTFAKTGP